ncbi:MAG: hypothetical protein R3Y24_16665 [Eubacteriales bacterium]
MCEILEQEREEGIIEGKIEEKHSVIINMLMHEFTENMIVSITEATEEEIRKIKNNL